MVPNLTFSFNFLQGVGPVGSKDATSDLTPKRIKGDTLPNQAKAETSKSSQKDSMTIENTSSSQHVVAHTSNPTMPVHEPLKPSFRPPAPVVGSPFVANRFKLDNRPTVFTVVPPLPSGLADVSYTPLSFSFLLVIQIFLLGGNSSLFFSFSST